MNDARFAYLMRQAHDGEFQSMMIAFPCTTFSIALFFDALNDDGDRGPEPVRNKDYPDGLPEDQLTTNLAQPVIEALEGSTADEPAYP